VVIDSRVQHARSWDALAATENRVLPEGHFIQGFGKRNQEIIPHILGWATDPEEVERISFAKEEAYRTQLVADRIEPLAGVVSWLESLRAAGIPCAVGSSTPRANVDCALKLWGWDSYFADMITAEDVHRGKPDPEVFVKAAQRLGLPPERVVVFEDSLMGIAAAHAAGARVVAVLGTHAEAEIPDVDRVVSRLDELTVEDVAAWFPG
jgi:HAD superfamily hydrolase (TIGR01509 family)